MDKNKLNAYKHRILHKPRLQYTTLAIINIFTWSQQTKSVNKHDNASKKKDAQVAKYTKYGEDD
jgi:hypothetical protein